MLDSIIYLGPNAVMNIRLSSHKSRFIYHFRIARYQKVLSSNKRLIEKL